eukprot:8937812-Alexandrium_andersonii.AAC.1
MEPARFRRAGGACGERVALNPACPAPPGARAAAPGRLSADGGLFDAVEERSRIAREAFERCESAGPGR